MTYCSQKGIDLIKSFEGCKLEAYRDLGGKLTIGWGHTGPDVTDGLKWTQDRADSVLKSDIVDRAEKYINNLVEVPLTDNQFSALCSLCYNIGSENFKKSTLLSLLNNRNYALVPLQIKRWNRINGLINLGLARRREAECELWNAPAND